MKWLAFAFKQHDTVERLRQNTDECGHHCYIVILAKIYQMYQYWSLSVDYLLLIVIYIF